MSDSIHAVVRRYEEPIAIEGGPDFNGELPVRHDDLILTEKVDEITLFPCEEHRYRRTNRTVTSPHGRKETVFEYIGPANAGGQIPPASGGNLDRLVGNSVSGEQRKEQ